jgi:hypothetical protein
MLDVEGPERPLGHVLVVGVADEHDPVLRVTPRPRPGLDVMELEELPLIASMPVPCEERASSLVPLEDRPTNLRRNMS